MPIFAPYFRQDLLERANLRELAEVLCAFRSILESARVDMRKFEKDAQDVVDDLVSSDIARTQRALAAKHDPKELAKRARGFLGDLPEIDRLEKGDLKAIYPVIRQLLDLSINNKVERDRFDDLWKLRSDINGWQDAQEAKSPDQVRKDIELGSKAVIQATKKNAARLLAQVNSAIKRVQAWQAGTDVVIEPRGNIRESGFDENGSESFSVSVGSHGADFTVFTNQGKVDEIDDVLEAGDTDFFHDPIEQVQYFDLIRELKSPGSTQRAGKLLTLWTARPVKDRRRYEGARTVPTNIFLTTDPDRAIGISRDLGGGRARDVWKVTIDSRYLVQTLNAGHIKDYQVVGKTAVPVKKLILDIPGD